MHKYNVATLRAAGLEAKWTRTRKGAPIIIARDPAAASSTFYAVDAYMWKRAEDVGLLEAFREGTALADFFSIPI